jgi:hypothetical protein
MSTFTFDTLKFANRLKTAGVPPVQAEAEADALSEVFEANGSELSTKADLREVETNLRHEISDLRKDIDAKLANLKFELLKWLIGLAVAQVGLVIGLLKFLS